MKLPAEYVITRDGEPAVTVLALDAMDAFTHVLPMSMHDGLAWVGPDTVECVAPNGQCWRARPHST